MAVLGCLPAYEITSGDAASAASSTSGGDAGKPCDQASDCGQSTACESFACTNALCVAKPDPTLCAKDGGTCCGSDCVQISADEHHCGTCGHDCQGGLCQGGFCQPLVIASKLAHPVEIAVLAESVYWTNAATPGMPDGSVMRAPIVGGSPTLIAGMQVSPGAIALDATYVYWGTTGTPPNFVDTSIMRATHAGGDIKEIVKGAGLLKGIAVNATTVFWADSAGNIGSAPIGGGISTLTSVPVGATAIAVDKDSVYWTTGGPGGSVSKMPLGAMSFVVLQGGQSFPGDLAVAGAAVYWLNQGMGMQQGTVQSISIVGSNLKTIAIDQLNAAHIAVDATSVYWTTNFDVNRAPVGGPGAKESLAQDVFPTGVAVDAKSVYWTSNSADDTKGSIKRIAK